MAQLAVHESIDCESMGLVGEAWAVGVVIKDKDFKEVARLREWCHPTKCEWASLPETDSRNRMKWLTENVLPAFAGQTPTCETPREVRDKYWAFLLGLK